MQPDMQRILIVDGPAILGLARYTELDEQYAHAAIVHSLTAAAEAGTITVEDPETATRLLLGALTRGAMLIANSPDPVETRHAVAKYSGRDGRFVVSCAMNSSLLLICKA